MNQDEYLLERRRLIALIEAETAFANRENDQGGWLVDHQYEIRRLNECISQLDEARKG